jgi:hypothetical protein
MSKPCFTQATLERYEGTLNRIRRNSIALSERNQENNNNINQLIRNMMTVDAALETRDEELRKGRKTLNDRTITEFVRDTLARARRPLAIVEILPRMERLGWITTCSNKYSAIQSALYTNLGTIFRRTERGKYTVIR